MKNNYTIDGNTVLIELSRGKTAKIDLEDLNKVSLYSKWHTTSCSNNYYMESNYRDINDNWKKMKCHRLVMNIENRKIEVDHINGDSLDNRKVNLRLVTKQQNAWNQKKTNSKCSSKYKGVSIYRTKNIKRQWRAMIKVNNKIEIIGAYETEEIAAIAYNKIAIKKFGEYACLNVI